MWGIPLMTSDRAIHMLKKLLVLLKRSKTQCLTKLNCGSYKWFLNCGSSTNTRVEVLGAWVLLTLANRLSLKTIHIMGDFKIIIDWLLGKGQLQVLSLDCWEDSITGLITTFQNISFDHVYREENPAADSLSKLALTREPGKLTYFQCIKEHEGPHLSLDLF